MLKVPLFKQSTGWNCGPACVQMLLAFHGKKVSQKKIAKMAKTTKNGTHHKNLVRVMKRFKIKAKARTANIRELKKKLNSGNPAILNYFMPQDNEGHFAVAIAKGKKFLTLNDPWLGKKRYSIKRFKSLWFDPEDNSENLAIFVDGKEGLQ